MFDREPLSRGTDAPVQETVHRIAFKTDIGRSHHVNQDAGGAWTWVRDDGTPASLLVVADGVSAGRRSEEVSRFVTERLSQEMGAILLETECSIDGTIEKLSSVIRAANHKVAERPHDASGSADATTLVAAICLGIEGGGAWVGDSRVYRVHGEGALRLTRDHSWAEEVVSQGYLTEEQAALDPRAHMITRWLGPPDQADPGIETFRFRLEDGDAVICCSDGLYGYYAPPLSTADEMARILHAHESDLQEAADRLVDVALERGGHDNITIAALQVVQDGHSGFSLPS
ncbi:MAG TPA: protein phosphatase 2C domain-containing protein [Chloroflexota bacterium]